MKKLLSYEKDMGAEGGKAAAALGVEGQMLKVELSASYPISKVIEPATAAVDALLDKLEKAIPGDWDKPMIDGFKLEYKADLVKRLSEA
jgi:hypothetical protein